MLVYILVLQTGYKAKKNKTINRKNEDDKCFQCAATNALNYEEIKFNPERVSNIKPFVNKYYWEGINVPSKIDDSKRFDKNNPRIAINICTLKKKKSFQLIFQNKTQPVENEKFSS